MIRNSEEVENGEEHYSDTSALVLPFADRIYVYSIRSHCGDVRLMTALIKSIREVKQHQAIERFSLSSVVR